MNKINAWYKFIDFWRLKLGMLPARLTSRQRFTNLLILIAVIIFALSFGFYLASAQKGNL